MTVRAFSEDDLDLVRACVPERAISTIHRERLDQQASATCRYLLALEGDRPAGWVVVRTGDDDRSEWLVRFDCAEVEDLYVTPRARHQGLGRQLMVAAEHIARDLGFGSIGLSTGGPSDPEYVVARRLYEGMAYVDVSRGPWIVGWSWISDRDERSASYLILESYFLKELPEAQDLRSRKERRRQARV